MKGALALLAMAPLLAGADAAKITFVKTFKGAVPPYYSVELNRDGTAVYKEAPNDDQPVSLTLPANMTAAIFEHVEKAGNGTRQLESGLKVANLGQKTLRYENGTQKNEVTFNYSLDPDAQAFTDMFEMISETQQHIFNLERTMRFDKLGVNKVLLEMESSYDRRRLLGYERAIPMLERVAKNESFLHMARERAERLAELLKNPPKVEQTKAQR